MLRFNTTLLLVASFMVLGSCADNGATATKTASPATAKVIQPVPQVDSAVHAFMRKHNVPGVSIAITKDGRLVHVKGYGYADVEAREPVTPSSLFRIASISKPITGIAFVKLAEEGKISLDAKVFGTGGILGTTYGTKPYSKGITDITVRQLLNHTSGGWVNDNNDPMFTNPTMTADELITWTLDNRPLDNTPGTAYAYSNFGYSILGRIIEKVTGQTYEQYVQTEILKPLGITSMQVGGNTLADRKPNEVKYYGQQGGQPYIYNITRMDAHGGWLANATDLVKLTAFVDGFASKPDVLKPESIEQMTTASTVNPRYALGWMVNERNSWWHTGSLPGTFTMLARTSGGFSWAILTNTRTTNPDFGKDIDRLVWTAINDSTTVWPNQDLF
ncbi:serine hydrolase domain-containing protein [Rufibacter roseus]|uniref:Serine hydrolase domain-containing protein n=1 Tax=Rufibacter roseus TaxID=1567108 RepID=A0ABW2DHZ3_9BACT|nr:serine hydrolase domain-containing protein [Rufibacter roseus]